MAWPPPSQLPDDPIVAAWWRKDAARVDLDAALADEAAALADVRAAERSERLRRRVRELEVRIAAHQAGDRWRRMQRSSERWSAGSRRGGEDESWSYRGLPVEHAPGGRVLRVR